MRFNLIMQSIDLRELYILTRQSQAVFEDQTAQPILLALPGFY